MDIFRIRTGKEANKTNPNIESGGRPDREIRAGGRPGRESMGDAKPREALRNSPASAGAKPGRETIILVEERRLHDRIRVLEAYRTSHPQQFVGLVFLALYRKPEKDGDISTPVRLHEKFRHDGLLAHESVPWDTRPNELTKHVINLMLERKAREKSGLDWT